MPGKNGSENLVDWRERRIAEQDLDTSMCVEAGAGTGKTRLLVNRYLNILKSGKAGCSEIVAITFTEKAASEMKERLRMEISRIIDESGGGLFPGTVRKDEKGGTDRTEPLSRALVELERAPISTIHAFASSLIRDYPVEAGIDPGFTQLVEPDSTVFLDDCWNEFLAETSSPYDDYIQRFMRAGGRVDNLKDLAVAYYNNRFEKEVRSCFEGGRGKASSQRPGGQISRGEPDSKASNATPLLELYSAYCQKFRKIASANCIDENDNGYLEIINFIERFESRSGLKGEALDDYLLNLDLPSPKGAKKNWDPPEKCTEYKELAAELKSSQDEYRESHMKRIVDGLTVWLDKFLEYVDGLKREEGLLDFDDLLIEARRLLDNSEVLESLRRRYRYILVDEFQDTDSIQAEIIFILAGLSGEDEKEYGEGRSSLFIVGDPKQSIYRFRKADIEVYERIKGYFAGRGTLRKITQNFRSGRGIVEWVNAVFSDLIRRTEEGDFQPDYEPIFAHRSDENAVVALLNLEEDFEEAKAEEMRDAEGRAAARLIKKLVEDEHQVRDIDTKEFRPVRYSDIAMIYRGSTGLEFYEEPLRSEGIPYVVEGGGLFYSRQEVRDLATALWAIEDPGDSMAIFSALRSSLFGFSDEEIFIFKERGGAFDYLAGGVPAGKRFEPFAEAFNILAGLNRRRNEMGSSWVVRELASRTNLREVSLFRPNGRQRAANIRKAVQTARTFDRSLYSFRQFARWFMGGVENAQSDRGLFGRNEPESSLVDEEENAVRLLSVHKSKGLQFPVVIMTNLLQRRTYRAGIFVDRGRFVELKIGNGWQTPGYEEALMRDRKREEAENLRLLYVAATRAGDLLVIPGVPKRNSFFEIISAYLPVSGQNGGEAESGGEAGNRPGGTNSRSAQIARELVSVIPASGLPELSPEEKPYANIRSVDAEVSARGKEVLDGWVRERDALIGRASEGPFIVTPSGAEGVVHALKEGEAENMVDGGLERLKGAASFGSAFHRIMEILDFKSPGDIDRLAGAVSQEYGVSENRDELASLVGRALASKIIKKASRSGTILREVPFTIRWDKESVPGNRPVYVSGRLDLLFKTDGEWTAVDYKTDQVENPEDRAEIYRPQGVLYTLALRRVGIELKEGIYFYFVRPGASVLIPSSNITEEDFQSLFSDL